MCCEARYSALCISISREAVRSNAPCKRVPEYSPVGRVDREEYGPGKSLDARLGQGQGKIRLESFSGDVDLELK